MTRITRTHILATLFFVGLHQKDQQLQFITLGSARLGVENLLHAMRAK